MAVLRIHFGDRIPDNDLTTHRYTEKRAGSGFLLLIVAVAVAKGLRGEPSVQHFIAEHPGTVERRAPMRRQASRRGCASSTSSTCSC